jgi:hypothetical protein
MTLAKATISDGGLPRPASLGDVLALAEQFPATLATNALTVTGQILAASFIQRTPTGAAADTLDSAANIIAAITSGLGLTGVQAGTTWRVRWHNNAAFVITVGVTANTGVTVTQGTVNASSVKDFLVTVVNGSPAAVVTANTTNASPTVTGLTQAQASAITPGMIVTNAVAGLQGQTVIGVNVAAGSVTFSGNANATAALQAINLSPVVTLQGIGQGLL